MANKKKVDNIDVVRESPSLFDENPVMIGRSKDGAWGTFNWGDKTDLLWEYAQLSDLNKHLIGTTKKYSECDESSLEYVDDVDVNETQNDIDKVVSLVNDLSDTQIGVCALYSIYKYSKVIKKNEFVLSDNYRNIIVSIMSNEDFKKFNDMTMNMINKASNDGKEV